MFQPASDRQSTQEAGQYTQRLMPTTVQTPKVTASPGDDMELLRNNQMVPTSEPEMFQYMETYREVGSDQGDPGQELKNGN